ncbi:uncharacterized protein LOC130421458 [Triplophysa dalaica]|uniref:uncharacterized protein LOC130421458 n=1 Tax=Triplophysa dalaica TaxID=1582913 RepID=UPI0024DFD735|nr:uncharacterized protein LOC130421458 [Triplophysa dalaica]
MKYKDSRYKYDLDTMTPGTMRIKFSKVFVIFVFICGCFASVLHGQEHVVPFTAELPLVSVNSVADIQMSSCSPLEVNRAISVVISSAGTMSDQALCALRNDTIIPSVTLQQLQTHFQQILKSAMNLSIELDPQTNVDVAALFWGNLDEETIQNRHFFQFWLYLKFLPVLPYIREQYLTQLSRRNFTCENFQMIVKVLSMEGTLVTDTQHQAFFTHLIYAYLSRRDTPDPGCLSNVANNTEWLLDNLGMSSGYATLKQLQALNSYFASFDSLSMLSPSQAAELTQDSEALNSVNMINVIFDYLEEGDVFRNADEFFATLTQSKALEIDPVVRDVMMNRTFSIISLHFSNFLYEDWVSWFTVKLVPLLPSMTGEMLQTATLSVDCTGYHVIVEGLNSVFDQMTLLKRKEITLVLVDYLKQRNGSGSTCGSDTSSVSTWLDVNFGQFSVYVAYEDLRVLNTDFPSIEALKVQSAFQVAQLTVDSGALNNTDMINIVFDLLGGSYALKNVDDFLSGLAQTSQALEIDPVVRDVMMNRTFAIISLHFSNFLDEDWDSWFTVNLVPLLPSMTAEMLQTATLSVDCAEYHIIVEGLNSVFDQMTVLRKQEITLVLVNYLKQRLGSGSTCGSDTSSLSTWLDVKFGQFSVYVAYEDLRVLNTDFTSIETLDVLNASQVAQLTVNSGALNNTDMIHLVFDHLGDGETLQNVDDFLSGLTLTLQALKIDPVVRDVMMNRTFAIISLHFSNFSYEDWDSWFTVKLVPLLPSLTKEMIQTATLSVDCAEYHVIVEGLNSAFDQMTVLRKQEITLVLVNYLKQRLGSGSTCGSDNSSLSTWLDVNFGKFYIYVAFEDLLNLNTEFSSIEAIDLLSASQLAQLTVNLGALDNTNMINMVFDTLGDSNAFQNVDDFLAGLAQTFQVLEINPVVRDIMMNRTFAIVSIHFSNFLDEDWVSWFTVKLVPLLPSMTAEMLQTATLSVNCTGYHVIVEGLRSVFDQMTVLRKQEITLVLVDYLKQRRGSGSTCGSDTSSLSSWLDVNFGQFSVYVALEDLRVLNTEFSNIEKLDFLSPSQAVQLTVSSGALNSADVMNMVFDLLEDGSAFQNIDDFLAGFANTSQASEINPVVRDVMMNRTFSIISLHVSSFLYTDWVSWFTVKLVPLLPSLTKEMLQRATISVDCTRYHVIVKGLSSVFDQMTLQRKQEITLVLVDYLKQNYTSASTCGSDTSSLSTWLGVNFGKFSVYVAYEDLQELNTVFPSMEALDNLNASEIALLTVNSGALNNTDMMEMVFIRIGNGNAFQNTNDFLTSLIQTAQALEIHPVVRDVMMNRTFSIISLHFSNFSYEDWVSWFTVKLVPFLPSLTKEMLERATLSVNCTGYHVIVDGLNRAFDQMTLLRKQEITLVLVDYLKQRHGSGSTCGSDTSSLSTWLDVNFDQFSDYVAFEDLRVLNTEFSNIEALDSLSPSQAAQLTVSSGALNNADVMNMVFDLLEDGNAFQNIDDFLTGLAHISQALEINAMVRDVMMNRTFAIISLRFSNFWRKDWVSWFTVKLVPLLPSLTAEMLQKVTLSVDCTGYHVIVKVLSSVFDQMTLQRKQEITMVLVDYLKQNYTSASTCGSDTGSLSSWLAVNFGKFSLYVAYEDLRVLNTDFSSIEALNIQSAFQVAQLTVDSGALNNTDMINIVFDLLGDSYALKNVDDFLSGLTQTSQALEINPVVMDVMMNRTFAIISLHFSNFLDEDWDSWFTVKLVPLLPSLSAEMLQTATLSADCAEYHIIVEGLNSAFDQMTLLKRKEIALVLARYLKQSYRSGTTCGSNTSSVSAWLDVNFGKFSLYVAFEDLQEREVEGNLCQNMMYCQLCQLCSPSSLLMPTLPSV